MWPGVRTGCGCTATTTQSGAANAVDKIVTGLALVKAADVLEVAGAVDAGIRERAYELGGTLAATLME